MNLIVFDLEWNIGYQPKTFLYHGTELALRGEIIQIGAVRVDENGDVLDTFEMTLRPRIFRKLHWRIAEVTGLSQGDLEAGVPIAEGLRRFQEWAGPDAEFAEWGLDDVPVLKQNLFLYNMDESWPTRWYDLQQIFLKNFPRGEGEGLTLESVVDRLGIEHDGDFHNALDDALYTTKICRRLPLAQGIAEYSDPAAQLTAALLNNTDTETYDIQTYFDRLDHDAYKNDPALYQVGCPFCGKPLSSDNFYIDFERKTVEVYCSDSNCMFYKYKQNRMPIPVYLVDEEIYSRCPSIILSTVDKFARLPWDVKTNALFGRVNRLCSRDGYVAIGDDHKRHPKTADLPTSSLTPVKSFAPPELIIQDELHLITGPLGTVYGAYETIIEDLCTYTENGRTVRPKYVVSTATIKNAGEQTKCLYGRKNTAQFPPNGFEIGDSFFINEVPVTKDPFRKYIGICANGQSMKTALLRVYAVLLQTSYELTKDETAKEYIDPYYSLVGYFNSIRELGGAVRLLQDDIPKRIKRLKKKYHYDRERPLKRRTEITSRMSSYEIPNKLKQLETPYQSEDCLDTAVATNMIAVGMDVDRLGLMVVTGQPKQNSEYIQATSRIGRSFPGLVVTMYNPYRPRDLSHYENFTGYHSQLYRFVEGTTATPFSARARDRVLHAVIISAIRLKYPDMANNAGAGLIALLTDAQINEIKAIILERLNIIKPAVRMEAEAEIDQFIDWWKLLAAQNKPLRYYVYKTDRYNRLMNYYGEKCIETEKATLSSMREVESASNMYYYLED